MIIKRVISRSKCLFLILLFSHSVFGIKNFVLISAPGSGKGTFSQYMIKNHNYVQICPGDLFRSEIAAETELGKKIRPIVERGDYLDEDVVCKLMEKHICGAVSQNKAFVLDGFPRSIFAFNFLHALFKKYDLTDDVCFVQLVATDQSCLDRIIDRLVCMKCFKVYNKTTNKPRSKGVCDECGETLSVRLADTAVVVQKRLTYFHNTIEPLMDLAQEYYPTIKINSECSFYSLEEQYEKLLEG